MSRINDILLSGTILYGDDLQCMEGYLCIRDGIIKEVGSGHVDARVEGIICPRFANAHTHIGDSVFKDPPYMSLQELVGPGGLKHQVLTRTARHDQIEAMRRTLMEMIATGTFAFADFREGGAEGVEMLLDAMQGISLTAKVLGRPNHDEVDIHKSCWGLGLSSTRDYSPTFIKEAVSHARCQGKIVAVHAGEAAADDIKEALDLEPDLLIHMCKASKEDLRKVSASGVPIVVCPRSNLFTGVGLPDVKTMMKLGITVAVGTDNVMLNSPSIFSEMELISKALLHDDRQVFKMCTLNGAKVMGIDKDTGSICEGKEARLMVIDRQSNNLWNTSDPLASIVRRARPSDILSIF